jgi:predicted peroxiredoxin
MLMRRLSVGLAVLAVMIASLASSDSSARGAPPADKQKVVIHLKHFTNDLHAAFMALKVANWMQAKGAQVTLFVDLEGARLADERQSLNVRWGHGADPLSKYYDSFVKGGGNVLVCPHCAEAAGLDKKSLRKGATIGSEAEIADSLLAADKIMDY